MPCLSLPDLMRPRGRFATTAAVLVVGLPLALESGSGAAAQTGNAVAPQSGPTALGQVQPGAASLPLQIDRLGAERLGDLRPDPELLQDRRLEDEPTPVFDLSRLPALGRDPSAISIDDRQLIDLKSRLEQGELAINRQERKSDWLMVDAANKEAFRTIDGTALDPARWAAVPGWSDDGSGEEPPVGITLEPQEVLLFNADRGARRAVLETETWVGSRVLVGSTEAVPGADGAPRAREIVDYGVRIVSSFTPLRWGEEAYASELTMALLRRDGERNAEWTPPRPLQLAFTDMGLGVELSPASVSFDRSGVAGSRTARLSFRRDAGESADFSISGDFPSEEFSFPAGVALGALVLESDNPQPLGLGLEEVTLTVTRLAQDGRAWSPSEPLAVTVATGRASGPAQVEIPAGESKAQFAVRTAGTGTLTIEVRADGADNGSIDLDLGLPWVLLLACLAGGVVGSLLRGPRNGKQASLGALIGLVAFALGTLGIRVTEVDPNVALTEVGAFAIAVLAALAGVSILPGGKPPGPDQDASGPDGAAPQG